MWRWQPAALCCGCEASTGAPSGLACQAPIRSLLQALLLGCGCDGEERAQELRMTRLCTCFVTALRFPMMMTTMMTMLPCIPKLGQTRKQRLRSGLTTAADLPPPVAMAMTMRMRARRPRMRCSMLVS